MDIVGTVVLRVLVDTGSNVNVLYFDNFKKLGLKKEMMRPINMPLSGFTRDSVQVEGAITLPVVDLDCTHNIIMGRLALEDLGPVISLEHLGMKFWTPEGVGITRCD